MSWFAAGAIDATLEERLARHDIHPTGPMAGRGDGPTGEAAALEARIIAAYEELPERLAAEGLEAARRPLRLRPAEFHGEPGPGTLTLHLRLPPGAYATAVIREILATDVAPTEFDDA
jgi:tRNA pseudouridine13 synthase